MSDSLHFTSAGRLLCTHVFELCEGARGVKVMQDEQRGSFSGSETQLPQLSPARFSAIVASDWSAGLVLSGGSGLTYNKE